MTPSDASPREAQGRFGLQVDVPSEIDLLVRRLLSGPWQVPVELVRVALARGATRVELRRSARRVDLWFEDVELPVVALRRAQAALDRSAPAEERHAAAVALERDGLLALVWPVIWPGRVTIHGGATGDQAILHLGRSGADLVEARETNGGPAVRLTGSGRLMRRAARTVAAACVHSPTTVLVDGVEVSTGFSAGLFRYRLRRPAPVELVVGVDLAELSLVLLRHGVVAARATVPGQPPAAAAVELAGHVAEDGSPADHRQAVRPLLSSIIDRMMTAGVALVPKLPELGAGVSAPLVRTLLHGAALGRSRAEVLRAPVICVREPSGRDRWTSPAELASKALPEASAPASAPPRPPRRLALLEPASRQWAGELVGAPWPEWTRAGRTGWRRRWARSLAADLTEWLGGVLRPVRVLSDEQLSEPERRLLRLLQAASQRRGDSQALAVGLTSGRRPPRRGGRRVVVGRDHPDVRRAAALVAADPTWAAVAATALGLVDAS